MTTIEEQLGILKILKYNEDQIHFECIDPDIFDKNEFSLILNDIANTVAAAKNYEQLIERLTKEMDMAKQDNISILKIQDQLLSKIRTLEDTVKYGFKEGTPLQHHKRIVEELEQTIERLTKELQEIKKGIEGT